MRAVLAWALYGIGHAIWWCFDRHWCGGMHWPIYKTYSAFMLWSDDVQGSGPGPWYPVADAPVEASPRQVVQPIRDEPTGTITPTRCR